MLQHFWSDHLLEHSKAMNKPKKTFKWPWKIKVSSTSSKFRLCASLKTCDLKFWELLKNCLRGILSTKKYFFLKILNFVQSFVECKVSLADGTCSHVVQTNSTSSRRAQIDSTSSPRTIAEFLPTAVRSLHSKPIIHAFIYYRLLYSARRVLVRKAARQQPKVDTLFCNEYIARLWLLQRRSLSHHAQHVVAARGISISIAVSSYIYINECQSIQRESTKLSVYVSHSCICGSITAIFPWVLIFEIMTVRGPSRRRFLTFVASNFALWENTIGLMRSLK